MRRGLVLMLALAACAPRAGTTDSAARGDAVAPGAADTTRAGARKSDSAARVATDSSRRIALPFRARGNEPGWSLDVGERELTLVADYGERKFTAATPAATISGDTTRWAVRAGTHAILVTVVDRVCHDGMSGFAFPRTVTVRLDDRELSGCGGESVDVLTGATWTVQAIDGVAVPEGSRPTLSFAGERVSGRACNRFTGGYSTRGDELTFTAISSTRMACAEPMMRLETRFLATLGAVRRFELHPDGTLLLSTDDARTITARR